MAQLNIRIADADKALAEQAAKSAGFSLGEYLGTIVSYMATYQTLPVVIKFKPMAITPEEAFQQAISKFRHAYLQVSQLCESDLTVGKMTPIHSLRKPMDDIEAAQRFYESNKKLIVLAAGQLEKIAISDTEHHMFACCQDYFPLIPGALRTAIRMVNMTDRPILVEDMVQMREALTRAAQQINALQEMVKCEVSASARALFFLRDIEETLWCAEMATKPGEAYMVCVAWKNRMETSMGQAEHEFQALGVVPHLEEFSVLLTEVRTLDGAVNNYLETTSEPMHGFDSSRVVALKDRLSALKQQILLPEK